MLEYDSIEDALDKRGRSFLTETIKPEGLKFKSGVIQRLTSKDIHKHLLFARAREITCPFIINHEPLLVIKILSELGEHENAINLAFAFEQGLGYTVANKMRVYNPIEEQSMAVDEGEDANKELSRQERIDL
jgi:hypothetical protein